MLNVGKNFMIFSSVLSNAYPTKEVRVKVDFLIVATFDITYLQYLQGRNFLVNALIMRQMSENFHSNMLKLVLLKYLHIVFIYTSNFVGKSQPTKIDSNKKSLPKQKTIQNFSRCSGSNCTHGF